MRLKVKIHLDWHQGFSNLTWIYYDVASFPEVKNAIDDIFIEGMDE